MLARPVAFPYTTDMTAKTATERVKKMRREREALGLYRRELFAHDDDWHKLRQIAAKMVATRRKK